MRHLYLFPEEDIRPSPDESDNPFGTSEALVTLGPFSAGWQDPDPTLDVLDSYGEPGNGAWDLGQGPTGEIRITVPIGNSVTNADFSAYKVEIQVNVVCYDVLVTFPSLSVEGAWMGNKSRTDTLAFFDKILGLWMNRTWTATLHNIQEDHVTVIISADAVWGSLIDAVEIYTLAVEDTDPLYTAMGVPIAWYQNQGLFPEAGDIWNDVDHYDSDGDGTSNWKEYVAGTDPNDSDAFLRIVTYEGGIGEVPYLEWIGGTLGPSAPYVIESALLMEDARWEPVGTRARVDGTNSWLGVDVLLEDVRFFRVVAPRDDSLDY